MSSQPFDRFFNSRSLHGALIIVLGIIVYSNTINVPFQFDDTAFIVENPIVKDFSFFVDPSKANTNPLVTMDFLIFSKTRFMSYLSLWANYRLGDTDVRGYHTVNLMLHLINALLVYFMVALTFKTPLLINSRLMERRQLIALFSGLVFVSHPIQTEAVTYILQRLVSLTAMFYLLSFTSYIASRLSQRKKVKYGLYALAIISATLAMKSKEIAFTLPVAIALYECMFFKDDLARRMLRLLPILLTMLIIPITYIRLDALNCGFENILHGDTSYSSTFSRTEYFFTQFSVLVSYIRLLFLPINQSVDHYHPIYRSFLEPRVLISFFSLGAVFLFGVYLYYRSRISDNALRFVSFGIFWFFITLSVESSVLPVKEIMVEYRIYLPSAGFLSACTVLLFLLSDVLCRRYSFINKALMPTLVLLITVMAISAYERNAVWATPLNLWKDAAETSPEKLRSQYNLGYIYLSEGQYDNAIKQLNKALRINPRFARAHYALGLALKFQGRYDEAIAHIQESLRLDVAKPHMYFELGNCYIAMKQYDNAIMNYNKALKMDPSFVSAYINLGYAYKSMNQLDKAIEYYNKAIQIYPRSPDLYYKVGNVYMESNRIVLAIKHYKESIRLRPDRPDVHYNLSVAYKQMGMLEKAEEEARIAAGLEPAR